MSKYFEELAILDFLGGRFENHNLPVDALGELITLQENADNKPPQTMLLWDEFAEITKDISDEAWSVLPSDYSSNLDLYLYGSSRHDK